MNGLRKKIQILTLSVITAMMLTPQFVSAESNNTTQSGIGSISDTIKTKAKRDMITYIWEIMTIPMTA